MLGDLSCQQKSADLNNTPLREIDLFRDVSKCVTNNLIDNGEGDERHSHETRSFQDHASSYERSHQVAKPQTDRQHARPYFNEEEKVSDLSTIQAYSYSSHRGSVFVARGGSTRGRGGHTYVQSPLLDSIAGKFPSEREIGQRNNCKDRSASGE